MTAVEQFENVVLGSGAAGKLTAWDLAGGRPAHGRDRARPDRRHLGAAQE
jgi:hypothetical protein